MLYQKEEPPPEAGPPAPAMGQGSDMPNEMPPEVFSELRKRFKGTPRGSAERNYGIQEGDFGGKHYTYDPYARGEEMGFTRDRAHGGFVNFLRRFGEAYSGVQEENLKRRQSEAAMKLKERELGADEVYRQAMLESQEKTRAESRHAAEVGIMGRAYDRATAGFLRTQPKPASELDPADTALKTAQAEYYHRMAESMPDRYPPGGKIKPDFTPDQAWTNQQEATANKKAIEREMQQIDATAPSNNRWLPDFAEAAFGVGHYGTQGDVDLTEDKGGKTVIYQTIPAAEVQAYRARLQRDHDFYTEQERRFREHVRNGGHVAAADRGSPGETATEGYDEDEYDTETGAAAAPPAGARALGQQNHRPVPPPEVLSALPYEEQVYYRLVVEHPEIPDAGLMSLAKQIAREHQGTPTPQPRQPRMRPGAGSIQ